MIVQRASDATACARKRKSETDPEKPEKKIGLDGFVDRKLCKEDAKKFNRLLVRAFVSGNIPYNFADNPEFREMMSFVRPSLAIPTRQTLSAL